MTTDNKEDVSRRVAGGDRHYTKCDSLHCPCFDEGFDEGVAHAERAERYGWNRPEVLSPTRPTGWKWVAHMLGSGGYCLIRCPHFGTKNGSSKTGEP